MRNVQFASIPISEEDSRFHDSIFTLDLQSIIESMKHNDSWAQGELNSVILLKRPDKQIVLTTMHEGTEIKFFPLNDSLSFKIIEGKIKLLTHQETFTLRKGQLLKYHTNNTLILTTIEETVLLLTISNGILLQSAN